MAKKVWTWYKDQRYREEVKVFVKLGSGENFDFTSGDMSAYRANQIRRLLNSDEERKRKDK